MEPVPLCPQLMALAPQRVGGGAPPSQGQRLRASVEPVAQRVRGPPGGTRVVTSEVCRGNRGPLELPVLASLFRPSQRTGAPSEGRPPTPAPRARCALGKPCSSEQVSSASWPCCGPPVSLEFRVWFLGSRQRRLAGHASEPAISSIMPRPPIPVPLPGPCASVLEPGPGWTSHPAHLRPRDTGNALLGVTT